jgi:hypothetical protein
MDGRSSILVCSYLLSYKKRLRDFQRVRIFSISKNKLQRHNGRREQHSITWSSWSFYESGEAGLIGMDTEDGSKIRGQKLGKLGDRQNSKLGHRRDVPRLFAPNIGRRKRIPVVVPPTDARSLIPSCYARASIAHVRQMLCRMRPATG